MHAKNYENVSRIVKVMRNILLFFFSGTRCRQKCAVAKQIDHSNELNVQKSTWRHVASSHRLLIYQMTHKSILNSCRGRYLCQMKVSSDGEHIVVY